MVVLVAELVVLLLLAGLLLYGLGVWSASPSGSPGATPARLPGRRRTEAAVARARWAPAHDEVDGETRVLLRRAYTGPDGLPAVLEERVFQTFPSADPAWEVRFTEAMADARYRCGYLNAEEER
ncbi:hypothetical protein SAMN05660359_00729 [Geodermatophilus obscurus]|uniref:Uncharacterized protein n=1 Tax=Geodermatophilus obscurus TaxID=1861 RepID=A0A1I5DEN5_9ACTN|nr:hypothetical protein [Geodermatophilus obscurus]SFN97724.1 hypothetical protein SAMN05660359_00729 [Geodermatophilus obscurus]